MSRRSIISCLAATVVGLMTVGVEEAVAQYHLYTLTKEGKYSVVAGDYIQVRYITQSIPNGIADLKVDISGDSIRKVGVFNASIPGVTPRAGGPYYFIALFRAEELFPVPGSDRESQRESHIVVTPTTHDGGVPTTSNLQEFKKFAFSLYVRPTPFHTPLPPDLPISPVRYHPKQPWRGGQVLEKRGSIVHPSRLGRQTSPEEGPRWTRGRNSATTPTAPHGEWSARGTFTSRAAPSVATDAPNLGVWGVTDSVGEFAPSLSRQGQPGES